MPYRPSGLDTPYPSEIRISAVAEVEWHMLGSEEDKCPKQYNSIVTYWDDTMTSPNEFKVEGFDSRQEATDDAHVRLATILPALKGIMQAAK